MWKGRESPILTRPLKSVGEGPVLPPRSPYMTQTGPSPCRDRTQTWLVKAGTTVHCSVSPCHTASKLPSLILYRNTPATVCLLLHVSGQGVCHSAGDVSSPCPQTPLYGFAIFYPQYSKSVLRDVTLGVGPALVRLFLPLPTSSPDMRRSSFSTLPASSDTYSPWLKCPSPLSRKRTLPCR